MLRSLRMWECKGTCMSMCMSMCMRYRAKDADVLVVFGGDREEDGPEAERDGRRGRRRLLLHHVELLHLVVDHGERLVVFLGERAVAETRARRRCTQGILRIERGELRARA